MNLVAFFAVLLSVSVALVSVRAEAPRATPSRSGEGVRQMKPPVARVEIAKDDYFGETLSDPYRWMENDKDAEWLPFLKAQNEYTRSVLDRLPGREALLKRIEQLSGDTVHTMLFGRGR